MGYDIGDILLTCAIAGCVFLLLIAGSFLLIRGSLDVYEKLMQLGLIGGECLGVISNAL